MQLSQKAHNIIQSHFLMKNSLIAAFLLLTACLHGQTTSRVWTDENGRKTKAEFVDFKDGLVLLLMPDGREIPYPIEKLSKIDQAFIEKFTAEQAAEKEEESEVIDNFGDPWPTRVTFKGDPEIETVKEDAEAKEFIYESANYRYICDVRLSKSVVKGFAVMFEATRQFTRELPLAVNGGKKTDGKYLILLFENFESYVAAGGPPSSAGVYIPRKNIVMVPLTSLGVQKVGSGYMLDRDKSNKTLPHELVHQLTPNRYYQIGAIGWFTEGLAEYVAITPYRSGSFNVRSNFRDIFKYVTAYGDKGRSGRGLGEEIKLGSLEKYMMLPYSEFVGQSENGVSMNYGSAALLAYYFFHLDREGDGARIKNFLKALNAGKKGREALEVLLDGQTFLELEEEIEKIYSRKGVDFIFSEEE